mgnify:CR=1 FL=1
MWYVVQTLTGQEEHACDLIKQKVNEDILEECFVPRYEVERKYHGEWKTLTRNLFPGYVIVVTNRVEELDSKLRHVQTFMKLLGSEESFVPLDRAEIAWINAFTKERHRVIGMSKGVMEGDKVIVHEGPLVGREGWIKKISRSRGIAYLEISMFGRTIEAKIGLAIVSKRD